MSKKPYPEYAEAAPAFEEDRTVVGKARPIGTMRVAKVTYDHVDIEASVNGTNSIGRMVDQYITTVVRDGGVVAEVMLYFETKEQQDQVAQMYSRL